MLFFIYGVVIYERHTKSCWRRKKTRWLWTKLKKIRAPLLYVFSRERIPWYGTFSYETKSHVGFLCWQHFATLKFWGRKNNLMDWKDACTELFGLAVLRSELDRRVERTESFFLNFSWANNNIINQRTALEKFGDWTWWIGVFNASSHVRKWWGGIDGHPSLQPHGHIFPKRAHEFLTLACVYHHAHI